MAWFPDPLAMETPTEESADYYRNTPQAWNNWIFVSIMGVFYVAYFLKVRKVAKGQKSKASAAIIVQCIIICFFNTVCALVYNSFTLITPDPWILLMGQICWSVNHGCPALIYITMNHTIRKEFRKLICRRKVHFRHQIYEKNWICFRKLKTQQCRLPTQ
ncbi:hypothetical protein CRE_22277 [Caenorhabditis remanei]|uniref:Uncharacterized protein n=1 Tax=Caenorhabditis remanei TaxID=31234 RepID=E3NWI2_CAERE|nr:hypothetical protein CRE_22277 [Caenorhabditis remanei]